MTANDGRRRSKAEAISDRLTSRVVAQKRFCKNSAYRKAFVKISIAQVYAPIRS